MEPHLVAPGTLYVVATPLGHLGDLTTRAGEVLRAVDVVAAEDTRRSRTLLQHIGATPRMLSVHAHTEATQAEPVLALLQAGQSVALVTDAGTPGVSDPGARLVAAVRAAGCPVVPIPGASAVATALSASGLPADRYLFLGFPARKGRDRQEELARAASESWTVVFYEAPNRLVTLLQDLAAVCGGERRAVVARELTKMHEELRGGSLAELAEWYEAHPPKGEITLLLAGASTEAAPIADTPALRAEASALLAEGLSRKDVVRRLTESSGLGRNEVYRLVMELP
ncbi:MAG TPA: 16S rRNA (cytidine(1402)-2'-O)-methyltransferase [Gemmatimonadales bacterium]|nr:16S rRNA (cytidine(1402)-2'-O)-methyltransferase [Gemmatimonadales bacterium]